MNSLTYKAHYYSNNIVLQLLLPFHSKFMQATYLMAGYRHDIECECDCNVNVNVIWDIFDGSRFFHVETVCIVLKSIGTDTSIDGADA